MGAPKLDTKTASIKNPTKTFDKYYTEELIIGLCGQLGTDLKLVSKDLKDILEEYEYECEEIKLSEFLFEDTPKPKDEFERILQGMNYGDQIRLDHNNEILATKAIAKILHSRTTETSQNDLENRDFKSRRKCFIINSIKHPDEVIAFQKVYENSFYLLGVFSSENERQKHLEKIISKKSHGKIKELIVRDNDDTSAKNGQKLRDVFTKSDYFIRFSSESLNSKINRFIDLIFDFGINTPTKDENAMFQATAAAVNSACLSRQVGACITDKNGEILSIGWNDVPKSGGGVYLHTDENDQRCFCNDWKCCTNSNKKENMISKIVTDLGSSELLTSTTISKIEEILKKNGIKDLIEFGRSVHAEMNAIIIGSQQTGDRMRGGNLFCTTFPCHNCARHIIMAGIKNVYYIEPYPKSLCLELHNDALTEDETSLNDKVKLLMYEGVAPKAFIKFYQLISDDRKDKVKEPQNKAKIKPKHRVHLEALYEKESHYLKYLNNLGLIPK